MDERRLALSWTAADVAHLRLARFTCLLDFRDSYYARSGLLDHLNSNGFDYRSDGLRFPRSFLHWRGFVLGTRNSSLRCFSSRSLGYLACLGVYCRSLSLLCF